MKCAQSLTNPNIHPLDAQGWLDRCRPSPCRREGRRFFLYGFEKNERANVSKDELKALQEVAKEFLGFDERQLAATLAAGELAKVEDDDKQS